MDTVSSEGAFSAGQISSQNNALGYNVFSLLTILQEEHTLPVEHIYRSPDDQDAA
jgi:hypothetical protein